MNLAENGKEASFSEVIRFQVNVIQFCSCYAAIISFLLVLAFWIPFRYKNQTVAIKVLHKGETPEEITKRQGRFAREVEMLSRVQHKNLVKV